MRVDGVDCGYFLLWLGENGVGKVEDLFMLFFYCYRGIAMVLIVWVVVDVWVCGVEWVNIVVDLVDMLCEMYVVLGFEFVCLCCGWLFEVTSGD